MSMYNVVISRQAQKKLKSLSSSTRARIAGNIKLLGLDPEDRRLDLKKMRGKTGYRMKVGQWSNIDSVEKRFKKIMALLDEQGA